VVSTVFTLLLIPALFSLALDARHWFMQLIFGRERLMPIEEESLQEPVGPVPEAALTR
jgi:hypothetical protein